VALDDVTLVGGPNLAILARCGFDLIKLDRSLVAELDSRKDSPEWLGAIKALLASSSLRVVAEGVETEHQLAALRDAGIQGAQGFHFSPPLSAPDFIAYYAERMAAR
jgi:EAL domain-containing protein (putative c-di-GMP-specific phosphodiesterase class I)